MPLALSRIAEYAEQCMAVQKRLIDGSGKTLPIEDFRLPNVPADAIDAIKGLIRSADRADGRRLARLLDMLQVHSARLRRLERKISEDGPGFVFQLEVETALLDAAELYALHDDLYEYARDRDEDGYRADIDRMAVALAVNGILEDEHENLYKRLFARSPKGARKPRV